MDGSDPVKIINTVETAVKDLAVDYNNSILYWVDNGQIYSSNYEGSDRASINSSILNASVPFAVSVSDGVLYWTQQRTDTQEGAIYSFVLEGGVGKADMVDSDSSLDPHDISAFVSKEVIASGTNNSIVQCRYVYGTLCMQCLYCLSDAIEFFFSLFYVLQ